jgi:hypothetical protein
MPGLGAGVTVCRVSKRSSSTETARTAYTAPMAGVIEISFASADVRSAAARHRDDHNYHSGDGSPATATTTTTTTMTTSASPATAAAARAALQRRTGPSTRSPSTSPTNETVSAAAAADRKMYSKEGGEDEEEEEKEGKAMLANDDDDEEEELWRRSCELLLVKIMCNGAPVALAWLAGHDGGAGTSGSSRSSGSGRGDGIGRTHNQLDSGAAGSSSNSSSNTRDEDTHQPSSSKRAFQVRPHPGGVYEVRNLSTVNASRGRVGCLLEVRAGDEVCWEWTAEGGRELSFCVLFQPDTARAIDELARKLTRMKEQLRAAKEVRRRRCAWLSASSPLPFCHRCLSVGRCCRRRGGRRQFHRHRRLGCVPVVVAVVAVAAVTPVFAFAAVVAVIVVVVKSWLPWSSSRALRRRSRGGSGRVQRSSTRQAWKLLP